jgi:putative glutamine amidotransferase
MSMPLIGITFDQGRDPISAFEERASITYINAIIASGGLPLIIPTNTPVEKLGLLREKLDGILLTGGGDIEFEGGDDALLIDVSPERDRLETALVKLAIRTNWPLLGICRGVQVMNVVLGGNLYIDIPTQFPTKLEHDTPLDQGRDFITHEVTIETGTRLAGILGKNNLPVNSFHHQAVKEIAPDLRVSARASDGLVEGLELPGQRFFVGVQWHPECIQGLAEQKALFQAFIQAASPA